MVESTLPVEMDGCITTAIMNWTFPKPKSDGEVVVTYPFSFEPG